jgi:hypothetical protein
VWSTPKEEFAKAFMLYIKRSEKSIQIGLVLVNKKLKRNSDLSPSIKKKYIPIRYFPVSVGTHLVNLPYLAYTGHSDAARPIPCPARAIVIDS